MAKAWKVSGLRPGMRLGTVARRVLAVRVAEFYSYAPFIYDPGRVTELHDMRIAAKRLRYTLEIFRPCYPPSVDRILEQVRELQELLGQIHDADVLVPLLQERLTAIAAEDEAALLARLDAEVDDGARLALIQAHLGSREPDRRLGIYALLGRTLHRRRRRYADFLDLWTRLETRHFRAQLMELTRAAPSPPAAPVAVELAASS
jgi:hypothetical protein